jgi:hypothetical protein
MDVISLPQLHYNQLWLKQDKRVQLLPIKEKSYEKIKNSRENMWK